jgi:hypothetical protein
VKRCAIAIAIALVSLIAGCDRVIDLSRTSGPDSGSGPDTGIGTDGGFDGIPDDGGGGGTDAGVD